MKYSRRLARPKLLKKVEVHEGASTKEYGAQPPRKPWLRQEQVHMGQGGRGTRKSGIPDPLADFAVPQERDVLRARRRWDSVKKVYEANAVTTEFIRLLVILVSDQFDCTR